MAKFTLKNPKRQSSLREPEVDHAALEAFAAGAKERGTDDELPPWERYDPDATPRYNVSIRMNDYQLEMLRYLSQVLEISQHKFLSKLLMPLLKQRAETEFEARRDQ